MYMARMAERQTAEEHDKVQKDRQEETTPEKPQAKKL